MLGLDFFRLSSIILKAYLDETMPSGLSTKRYFYSFCLILILFWTEWGPSSLSSPSALSHRPQGRYTTSTDTSPAARWADPWGHVAAVTWGHLAWAEVTWVAACTIPTLPTEASTEDTAEISTTTTTMTTSVLEVSKVIQHYFF